MVELSLQGKFNYSNTRNQRNLMIKQEKLRMLTDFSKSDFEELYRKYGTGIDDTIFAKYFLDIPARTLELLKKGSIKQTKILGREYVTQKEINQISKKVLSFLQKGDVKKVNYFLFMNLYERFCGKLDAKTFAEEVLGIAGNSLKRLKSDKEKEFTIFSYNVIDRDEIKRRQDELVKKEKLYIGKPITLEELRRLYETYGNGLSEDDFATKILQINSQQYGRLSRGAYHEMPILAQYPINPKDITKLRALIIKKEGLKVEESIDKKRFEKLYETYGGPLTVEMFAEEILGMSPGCEVLKVKAKKELSDEEKEKIKSVVLTDIEISQEFIAEMQALIMKEKNIKAREPLTIERIRELHQEYCPVLPERTFATVLLDIPYDNYIGVRNQNNTTESFVSFPIQEFDFASIRTKIIKEKKLHYYDNITYQTLQRWHQEYAKESDEKEFAEKVLDITSYALKGIKRAKEEDNSKQPGTNILKKEPLPTEKDIWRMRYSIVEEYSLHARDFIKYADFQRIYDKYGGILPDYMFAEQVLTISREQLRNMRKDHEKESMVFGQVKVPEREIENLISIIFYDPSILYGESVAPTQFYNLYNRTPHCLTPIQFSEKILGISKRRYLKMMGNLVFDNRQILGYIEKGMDENQLSEILQLPKNVVRKKIKSLNNRKKRKIKRATGKIESKGKTNKNLKSGETSSKDETSEQTEELSERVKKGIKLRNAVNRILDIWNFGDNENIKIREYISNCYARHNHSEFAEEELGDLEESLYALQVGESDIIRFSKMCMSFGKYSKANNFIINSIDNPNVDESGRERLKQFQSSIQYAIKKAKVVDMLFLGEKDVRKISQRTGLMESDVMKIMNRMKEEKEVKRFPESPDED